mgnify:CR=1 FL=1
MTVDELIEQLQEFSRVYGGDHKIALEKNSGISIVGTRHLGGNRRSCLLILSEDIVSKQEMLDQIDDLNDEIGDLECEIEEMKR